MFKNYGKKHQLSRAIGKCTSISYHWFWQRTTFVLQIWRMGKPHNPFGIGIDIINVGSWNAQCFCEIFFYCTLLALFITTDILWCLEKRHKIVLGAWKKPIRTDHFTKILQNEINTEKIHLITHWNTKYNKTNDNVFVGICPPINSALICQIDADHVPHLAFLVICREKNKNRSQSYQTFFFINVDFSVFRC